MITVHQPTIFGPHVIAAVSSKQNGNMKFGLNNDEEVLQNRSTFLQSVGIDIHSTSLVGVTYDTDDFAKYHIVTHKDRGSSMFGVQTIEHADALATTDVNHALFLPLADCVGAILYDSDHRVLMVSHLGRHSVEVEGAKRSVAYLKEHFSSDPAHIKVWLSPGVGKATYPLHAFDGKGLHEVITTQLHQAGVVDDNIENPNINTAMSKDYYSHSEYLKGNDEPGRFAIVAMMTAQGEPAT